MLDKATLNWVKSQQAKNYPRAQLEKYLRGRRCAEADIQAALGPIAKNSTSSVPGPQGAKPTAGEKNPMIAYVLAGAFFIFFIIAAILAFNNSSEVSDLKYALSDAETQATNDKQSLTFQKQELEQQLNDLSEKHNGEIAEKDKKIEELNVKIADLEKRIAELETLQSAGPVTETGNGTIVETNETINKTGNESTETEYLEEEFGGPDVPIYVNDNQQLYFPNETVDYDTTQQITLKVWGYNPNAEEIIMMTKITCFDQNQEEFTLGESECEYVFPGAQIEFDVFIPPFATHWTGHRDCVVSTYETDEFCEGVLGDLTEKQFVMDIYRSDEGEYLQ